jgi:hypothetical protein
MTTFSQLVDSAVLEAKRPDLRQEIANYLNQTIRELHFEPKNNSVIFYSENLVEELLVANVESGFGWDIPLPADFQKMAVVKYLTQWLDGQQVFPREITPSRGMGQYTHFFYRAGGRFNFSEYGGVNAQIALAYFRFPRRLLYKPSGATRYAEYNPEDGWTYPSGANTPEAQLAARTLSSNWLLMRWVDVVAEGLRAKIYKRLSDDPRARTSYSLYASLRNGVYTSEVADIGGIL